MQISEFLKGVLRACSIPSYINGSAASERDYEAAYKSTLERGGELYWLFAALQTRGFISTAQRDGWERKPPTWAELRPALERAGAFGLSAIDAKIAQARKRHARRKTNAKSGIGSMLVYDWLMKHTEAMRELSEDEFPRDSDAENSLASGRDFAHWYKSLDDEGYRDLIAFFVSENALKVKTLDRIETVLRFLGDWTPSNRNVSAATKRKQLGDAIGSISSWDYNKSSWQYLLPLDEFLAALASSKKLTPFGAKP